MIKKIKFGLLVWLICIALFPLISVSLLQQMIFSISPKVYFDSLTDPQALFHWAYLTLPLATIFIQFKLKKFCSQAAALIFGLVILQIFWSNLTKYILENYAVYQDRVNLVEIIKINFTTDMVILSFPYLYGTTLVFVLALFITRKYILRRRANDVT